MADLSAKQGQKDLAVNDNEHASPIEGEDKVSDKASYKTSEEVSDRVISEQVHVTEKPELDAQPLYSIYTSRQKWCIVFMSALGGFFSPLSANTYLPATPSLARYLNVSPSLINLTVTAFLIFQGLAPSIYGDLADFAGRRPAYLVAFTVYVAANIGLATQSSYASLFVLRCLQSSGSGGLYSLNSGIISDIATTAERGKYMGAAQSGIMLGPAIGPILGGLLDQYLGWRSIFWFLTICGGVYLIVFAIFVPETARNVVGNGSIPPQGLLGQSLLQKWQHHRSAGHGAAATLSSKPRKFRFPNPLKALLIIGEKDCAVILFFNAIIYAAWYTVTANLSNLLSTEYGLDALQIGLCYIPFGAGAALSIVANGYLLDRTYASVARATGFPIEKKRGTDLTHFPIERARMQSVWPLLYLGSAATIGFGWAVDRRAPLAVPLVMTFLMALWMTAVYNSMNILLVDLYPNSPSTASAANNLTRCLMAAGASAVIEPMIRAMGVGWAYTFVGLLIFVLSPMILVVVRYGPGWRRERAVRLQKRKEAKEKAKSAAC